jgi:hypothetical protein
MDRAPLELDENRVDHLLRGHQRHCGLRLLDHRDRLFLGANRCFANPRLEQMMDVLMMYDRQDVKMGDR